MVDEFLPKDFNVPETDGNYMRLRQGENQFRIMGKPILGWELWVEGKPMRFRVDESIPVETMEKADIDKNTGEPRMARYFMAFVVWNYNASPKAKLQILELTQKGIQKAITALNKSKAWGNPIGEDGYDILVNKEGEGLDTEYSVNPAPKVKLDKSIVDAYEKANVDLEALYKGEDPFSNSNQEEAEEIAEEVAGGMEEEADEVFGK